MTWREKPHWNLTLFCFCAQLKYNMSLFSILTEYFQWFQEVQHSLTCPLLERTRNIDPCPGFIAGPQMNLEIRNHSWYSELPQSRRECVSVFFTPVRGVQPAQPTDRLSVITAFEMTDRLSRLCPAASLHLTGHWTSPVTRPCCVKPPARPMCHDWQVKKK